jgi:hypothetical protein
MITADITAARKALDDRRKQEVFAAIMATNAVAYKVREHLIAMMRQVFDRPTQYMLRAVWVEKANKGDPVAKVGFFGQRTAGAAKTIAHHTTGGKRRFKGVEGLMLGRGQIASGDVALPGAATKTDASGNITASRFRAILRDIGGGGPLFAITENNRLSKGVYRRMKNGKLKSVLKFGSMKPYRKRLDMAKAGQFVAKREFDTAYSAALSRALQSAR